MSYLNDNLNDFSYWCLYRCINLYVNGSFVKGGLNYILLLLPSPREGVM